MNATVQAKKRGMLLRALAGAVVGAGGTVFFVEMLGKDRVNIHDPGTALAIVAGLSYVLMGVLVGVGTLVPSAGAKYLNIESAEELRDESPRLKVGAVMGLLIGAFFLLMAARGSVSPSSDGVISYAAAACVASIVVLGLVGRKHSEELNRQITLEVSHIVVLVAALLLACAAIVRPSITWLTPLALLAMLALLTFIATLIVSAAKGLLIR